MISYRTYAGTAGVVSDFSKVPRDILSCSSLSEERFSCDAMFLRELMSR